MALLGLNEPSWLTVLPPRPSPHLAQQHQPTAFAMESETSSLRSSVASRSFSHSFLPRPPTDRPRLPRHHSAPGSDLSDDDRYEAIGPGREKELQTLMGLMKRRGSWCESEEDEEGGAGTAVKDGPARARSSWRELYATLPTIFSGLQRPSSSRRPPPQCVLGKAPPVVGIVQNSTNQLFEWTLVSQQVSSTRRRRPGKRLLKQTSLQIHLQPPFYQNTATSSERLLPPWESRSASSPVGSDTTIRPRDFQTAFDARRQLSSPTQSIKVNSSLAQNVAPTSPLGVWERKHRRSGSTPNPGSLSSSSNECLSASPSSVYSYTPRAGRLPHGSHVDPSVSSLTFLMSSPPPIVHHVRASHTKPHQYHSKAPSLSNSISTAPSSLASPTHVSSFRYPTTLTSSSRSSRAPPLATLALPLHHPPPNLHRAQHRKESSPLDYRFPAPSHSSSISHPEGISQSVDIANSTLADLVFASLNRSATPPSARKLSQHGRLRSVDDDVFSSSIRPISSRATNEQDSLRRSRTSAGTNRRSQATLMGSFR